MAAAYPVSDMFLRGLAAGALLSVAAGSWVREAPRLPRLLTVLACVSLLAWLAMESAALRGEIAGSGAPWLADLFDLISAPAAALFWLLSLSVFSDRTLPRLALLPVALLLLCGVSGAWLTAAQDAVVLIASDLLSLALLGHAVFVIASGWRGDLLGARRRARAVVLGLGAIYGVGDVALGLMPAPLLQGGVLQGVQTSGIGGAAVLAAITLAAAAAFLQARPGMFATRPAREAGGASPPAAAAAREASERADLARLQALIDQGIWREEGLSIGALAARLGLPEHRLRPLINDRLGFRNFNEFLNAYRIQAARQCLADPQEARRSIASIAYDLGYGSLGPFNRAFRAETGQTPSAWRRAALAGQGDAPNAENP